MSQYSAPQCVFRDSGSRARRWWLAGGGMTCVALGAVGIVVPGLPTTVFLLIASWCFTRSCPWLEERLLRHRIFRRFLRDFEPGGCIPRRARITSTIIMWIAIIFSSLMIRHAWIVGGLIVAGVIGTWCVWRFRRDGERVSLPARDVGEEESPQVSVDAGDRLS